MTRPARILITGADGFIGSALSNRLCRNGYDTLGTVRTMRAEQAHRVAVEISATADWSVALENRDMVIHTAGRAHVLRETETDPPAVFRAINTAGTLRMANQAAAAGVRRFVFISSIGVNGLFTPEGCAFSEQSPPAPHNAYAIAKHEAEQGLRQIAGQTGMEVVIIRSPLVYGPGVKGNFLRLMRLLQRGLPLPFGAVANRRSLVGLDNLVDLLICCLEHPAAANQTFLVSDGEDLSTPELIRRLARAMNRPARLLSVPVSWLRLGGRLLGRAEEAERLLGSLQVDSGKARVLLGWRPPVSVDEGLRKMVVRLQG